MKRILVLSAENTGQGHKSITQALREQYTLLEMPVTFHEVDSFKLVGKIGELAGKLYNKVAVYTPFIWKAVYGASNFSPKFANYSLSLLIRNNLMKIIKETNPDIIVSVHPCFVGSVINVLKREKLNIPLIAYVADFDNVTTLWADKRSLYTLCPTENAKKTIVDTGIPEDKIKVTGFPVRERFNNYTNENRKEFEFIACDNNTSNLTFLIMNGSQGTNKSIKMAKVLLDNFDCSVTILAGKSKVLKKLLEDKLTPYYKGRVTILGFVENVEHYMANSDILILRASPNVLTEAINSCKPIIVTGSLMGQEERNPQFVVDNNLGIICKGIQYLPKAVNSLLADNRKKMKEICNSQQMFRKPQAAKNIAEFIFNSIDEIK